MGNRNFLLVAAAIALSLAITLIVDVVAQSAATTSLKTNRIFPGFSSHDAVAITIRAGAGKLDLTRVDDTWIISEKKLAAEPGAIADLLGTIEMLTSRRRASGAAGDSSRGLENPRAVVIVKTGTQILTLHIGDDMPAAQRTWVSVPGQPDAHLVDLYAARSLLKDQSAVRAVRPFATIQAIASITIQADFGRLEASGTPVVAMVPDGRVTLSSVALSRLLRVLYAIRVSSFSNDTPMEPGWVFEVSDGNRTARLAYMGPCPQDDSAWMVSTNIGVGCVPITAALPLADLANDPSSLFSNRLVPALEVVSVAVVDGNRREMARIDSGDGVRRWLRTVDRTTTGKVAVLPADARTLSTVELILTNGSIVVVDAFQDDDNVWLRRQGDTYAFSASKELVDHLIPHPGLFREVALTELDADRLRWFALKHKGKLVTYVKRLSFVGWDIEQPLDHVADVEAIALFIVAVSNFEAIRFLPASEYNEHFDTTVEIGFDSEVTGEPGSTIVIELGRRIAEGCIAKLGGEEAVFLLDDRRCNALLGPWSTKISRRPPDDASK